MGDRGDSGRTPDENAVEDRKMGYLWKSGYTFSPSWRSRFFVLDGRRITYFNKEQDSFTPGSVAKLFTYLQDGFEIKLEEKQNLSRFAIYVIDTSTNTKVEMQCSNESDALAWVASLKHAMTGGEVVEERDGDGMEGGVYVSALALEKAFDDIMTAARHHHERDQLLLCDAKVKLIEASMEKLQAKAVSGALNAAEMEALQRVTQRRAQNDSFRLKVEDDVEWVGSCLKEFDSNEGWEVVSNKADQMVFSKREEGSSFESVKIDTMLRYPLVQLASLFSEVDLLHHWVPSCSSADLLGRPTNMSALAHLALTMPVFVPISNRDMILEGRGVDMMQDRSEVLIMIRSVEQETLSDAFTCTLPPPARDIVRIAMFGGFQLKLLGPGLVRMRIIINADFKLQAMPSSLLNYFNKKVAPSIVHFIKRECRKFDSSEYKTRVRNNREFYGDIEDRVADFEARKASRSKAPQNNRAQSNGDGLGGGESLPSSTEDGVEAGDHDTGLLKPVLCGGEGGMQSQKGGRGGVVTNGGMLSSDAVVCVGVFACGTVALLAQWVLDHWEVVGDLRFAVLLWFIFLFGIMMGRLSTCYRGAPALQ